MLVKLKYDRGAAVDQHGASRRVLAGVDLSGHVEGGCAVDDDVVQPGRPATSSPSPDGGVTELLQVGDVALGVVARLIEVPSTPAGRRRSGWAGGSRVGSQYTGMRSWAAGILMTGPRAGAGGTEPGSGASTDGSPKSTVSSTLAITSSR